MLSLFHHPFFSDSLYNDDDLIITTPRRPNYETGGSMMGLRSQTFENEQEYGMIFDVPGVKPEDIEVSVNEGILSIKGHRELRSPDGKSVSKSNFARSYQLGDVDFNNVKADLHDGVLEVKAPKKPRPEPMRITVSTSGGAKKIEAQKK